MQQIEDIGEFVFKTISVVLVTSPQALEQISCFPWMHELIQNDVHPNGSKRLFFSLVLGATKEPLASAPLSSFVQM